MMRAYFSRHPGQKWTVFAVAALSIILLLCMLLFDWNQLRPWLARTLSARTGREVSIQGDLRVHPWSVNPTVSIDGLRIRNPGWAQRPDAFSAARIVVQVSLGHLLRGEVLLPLVSLSQPRLDVERRSDGLSNWQSRAPASQRSQPQQVPKLPAIRRLSIERGELQIDDRMRKLQVTGRLRADEKANGAHSSAFELQSTGSINERHFELLATGGALLTIDPDTPYALALRISAGDIQVQAQVRIDKPFDLSGFEARFAVSGNDLADAYYLTGLALPNTARYSVNGELRRSANVYAVQHLHGRIGDSDIQGDANITLGGERPHLTARLTSNRLNLQDLVPALGQRKARLQVPVSARGRAEAGSATEPALFPDADLQLERVRAMDADVAFRGASVTGKIPVREVQLQATLENGLLRLQPLSFVLEQGRFYGQVQIDARRANPESRIDMVLSDADLAQFKMRTGKQSPLSGPVRGRLRLHGYGSSVHKFVSGMDGNINVAVPRGEIRSAFAELTGINIARGLGLLISGSDEKSEVRCAVAAFHSQGGQLSASTLLLDTTNVLITGHGGIDLANERLDLQISGKPKKLRLLRLRSPIQIYGRLRHPKVGIEAGKPLLQAGAATVLGALLTPVAAALAFIDPGLAKDVNCGEAIAAASQRSRR